MTTLILLINAILNLGFMTPKKEVFILGTFITNEKNKDNILGLTIEFRVDTIVIAKSLIQQNRTFKIATNVEKEFDIYYYGIGVGDTYLVTIKPNEKDTLALTFNVPKEYKKKFGKTVCPKCNKYDQTVPIRYGDNAVILVQSADNDGNKTIRQYDKKNYYAGTCVTSDIDPKYYCIRDNIKF